jgi:tetratricopeptide (TPR) repeat protein
MKAILGADHPDTLLSMNNLAQAYQAAGKLERALPLLEETLPLMKAILGADHPDTLMSMNNLAQGYKAASKLDRALPLLEETLRLRKARLGVDHPQTLLSMNNLALGYQAAGKLDRALPLLEEALQLRKKILGADHPDTLASMNNLAVGYQDAGELDLGLAMLDETLKRTEAKLGADHPQTLASMKSLAVGYQRAGKLDRALPLLQGAAAGIEKLQFEHEYSDGIIAALIDCCKRLKRFDEAERWGRKWAVVVQKRFGADSIPYAGELESLGLNLLWQQKCSEAEAAVRESLAIREKLQPEMWSTFNTRAMLGATLLVQKKYAEAEPLLLAAYEGMKEREATIPAPEKPRLTEALGLLVLLYEDWEKPDLAAAWRKKLEDARAGSDKAGEAIEPDARREEGEVGRR